MASLIAACFLFFAIHIFVSGTPLRDRIVGTMGERAYRGVFALTSLGALVWMGFAYAQTKNLEVLWIAPGWTPHAGALVVLIAFLFAVVGLTTPNPTSVEQEALLKKGDEATRGIVRITRHPFLWGVTLWAAFHLWANGDLASVFFFGTFIAVALPGMAAIDRKRKRALGAEWDSFAAKTSLIPFAAIASGRAAFDLKGIGIVRPAAGATVFALFMWGHAWLFGVPAYY